MGTSLLAAALFFGGASQVVPQAEVVSQAPPSPLFVEIAATDARPCVRLYRNGGSAGCSSPRAGSVAVLLPVGSAEEVAQFAAAGVRAHAVVPSSFFSNTTLGALDATGNLAGVLVLPWRLAGGSYAVPEKGYAPARASSWNPAGEDLLRRDLGYPIFEIATLDDTTRESSPLLKVNHLLTGLGRGAVRGVGFDHHHHACIKTSNPSCLF